MRARNLRQRVCARAGIHVFSTLGAHQDLLYDHDARFAYRRHPGTLGQTGSYHSLIIISSTPHTQLLSHVCLMPLLSTLVDLGDGVKRRHSGSGRIHPGGKWTCVTAWWRLRW